MAQTISTSLQEIGQLKAFKERKGSHRLLQLGIKGKGLNHCMASFTVIIPGVADQKKGATQRIGTEGLRGPRIPKRQAAPVLARTGISADSGELVIFRSPRPALKIWLTMQVGRHFSNARVVILLGGILPYALGQRLSK